MEKSREEKINELKALRAELLALKDQEDGESSSNPQSISSLRKSFENQYNNDAQNPSDLNSARSEMESQYSGTSYEDEDNNQKVLVRRR